MTTEKNGKDFPGLMIGSHVCLTIADNGKGMGEETRRKVFEPFFTTKIQGRGEVNKMVADADGQYLRDQIEADVYQEQQQLLAKAIQAEGIAEANGIQEMNNALAGSGGEAIVKLRIAEAIQGKRIILLPVSEGGMNLKTTDINRLIETLGIKALSGAK